MILIQVFGRLDVWTLGSARCHSVTTVPLPFTLFSTQHFVRGYRGDTCPRETGGPAVRTALELLFYIPRVLRRPPASPWESAHGDNIDAYAAMLLLPLATGEKSLPGSEPLRKRILPGLPNRPGRPASCVSYDQLFPEMPKPPFGSARGGCTVGNSYSLLGPLIPFSDRMADAQAADAADAKAGRQDCLRGRSAVIVPTLPTAAAAPPAGTAWRPPPLQGGNSPTRRPTTQCLLG